MATGTAAARGCRAAWGVRGTPQPSPSPEGLVAWEGVGRPGFLTPAGTRSGPGITYGLTFHIWHLDSASGLRHELLIDCCCAAMV